VISFLSYIVPFLAVLTIIVFVHELGHYLVARWCGHCHPDLFGRLRPGTCRLYGQARNPLAHLADSAWRLCPLRRRHERHLGNARSGRHRQRAAELKPRLFVNKNVWQRIAVVVAGPLANVIFTFLILYALLLGYGRYTISPVLDEITPGSVAAEAGLMAGDRVVSVDGFAVRGFRGLSAAGRHRAGAAGDRGAGSRRRPADRRDDAGSVNDHRPIWQRPSHRQGRGAEGRRSRRRHGSIGRGLSRLSA
jgi:membrane-associated protease RseP (regulator of RpoE activity)